uniref:Putative secreted peptide n=1 Tax=Anopheles braziliensis TaxID=58242 RepID=A0A2M3ZRF6_9DIPT
MSCARTNRNMAPVSTFILLLLLSTGEHDTKIALVNVLVKKAHSKSKNIMEPFLGWVWGFLIQKMKIVVLPILSVVLFVHLPTDDDL